jgi:hypothetical protein
VRGCHNFCCRSSGEDTTGSNVWKTFPQSENSFSLLLCARPETRKISLTE